MWQKVLNEGKGPETIILLVSQVLPSATMSVALSGVTQLQLQLQLQPKCSQAELGGKKARMEENSHERAGLT